jgi:hypothetical protein
VNCASDGKFTLGVKLDIYSLADRLLARIKHHVFVLDEYVMRDFIVVDDLNHGSAF